MAVLLLVAGLLGGCVGSGGPPQQGEAVRALGLRNAPSYPSGRAHPHGPEADEVTRALPRLYARPAWSGGGRHPVWRGCQHVYDPTLASFIFSSGRGSG
jgi:hypothetical protein